MSEQGQEIHELTSDLFPRDGGSGSGSETAFSVEARVAKNCGPLQVGNKLLDEKWRRFSFDKATMGVPNHVYEGAVRCGLLTYEAACALRWWLHAEQKYFLETRLIRHQITHSYKETLLQDFDYIDSSKISDAYHGQKP